MHHKTEHSYSRREKKTSDPPAQLLTAPTCPGNAPTSPPAHLPAGTGTAPTRSAPLPPRRGHALPAVRDTEGRGRQRVTQRRSVSRPPPAERTEAGVAMSLCPCGPSLGGPPGRDSNPRRGGSPGGGRAAGRGDVRHSAPVPGCLYHAGGRAGLQLETLTKQQFGGFSLGERLSLSVYREVVLASHATRVFPQRCLRPRFAPAHGNRCPARPRGLSLPGAADAVVSAPCCRVFCSQLRLLRGFITAASLPHALLACSVGKRKVCWPPAGLQLIHLMLSLT